MEEFHFLHCFFIVFKADTAFIDIKPIVIETVTEDTIYTYSNGKMIASEYAKSQYGLNDVDASIAFNSKEPITYSGGKDTQESFGGNLLYFNDVMKGLYLTWENLGTHLYQRKEASYNLDITIEGFEQAFPASGKITILTTDETYAPATSPTE